MPLGSSRIIARPRKTLPLPLDPIFRILKQEVASRSSARERQRDRGIRGRLGGGGEEGNEGARVRMIRGENICQMDNGGSRS